MVATTALLPLCVISTVPLGANLEPVPQWLTVYPNSISFAGNGEPCGASMRTFSTPGTLVIQPPDSRTYSCIASQSFCRFSCSMAADLSVGCAAHLLSVVLAFGFVAASSAISVR